MAFTLYSEGSEEEAEAAGAGGEALLINNGACATWPRLGAHTRNNRPIPLPS